ncbi:MAG: ATP-dependent Clp protease ATP-binding subunit [Chitinophagaceae bacterium]|nr:ATP-dependent Clp protease ATP-binding subunit [Chitinophagaceae bacterium]
MSIAQSQQLSADAKQVIHIAQQYAREFMHAAFSPAHILRALLHKDFSLLKKLESLGVDVYYIEEWAEIRMESYPKASSSDTIFPDKEASAVLAEADHIRLKLNRDEVDLEALLISCVTPGVGFNYEQLKTLPVSSFQLLEKLQTQTTSPNQDSSSSDNPTGNQQTNLPITTDALLKYCIHKTQKAREGSLQPILGRDKEIRQMCEILSRKSKSNVILMGEPGVGKSALLDGFALAVVNNKVPLNLRDTEIYEVDNGALMAGVQYKGEMDDRLRKIIKEITSLEKGILFIDELHTLIDKQNNNGGAVGVLKPELGKGLLTMVGTTTLDEYRKSIEKDEAFNRRFESIKLDEPDMGVAEKMIVDTVTLYEDHHKLKLKEGVVSEAVRLAKRFVKERRLPDSAIDLIDRTLAVTRMMADTAKHDVADLITRLKEMSEASEDRLDWFYQEIQHSLSPVLLAKLNEEKEFKKLATASEKLEYLHRLLENLLGMAEEPKEHVDVADLAAVVANKTGIPIGKVQTKEKERLINMEKHLNARVIGQDHALKTVAEAILESRSGLNKSGQPIASFFFLGPTGTGKTELAKSMAEFLFQDENSIIRFDMSEFKEEHSAALLYGAPPGYVGYEEGGMLVNKIRQQPYAIVLFDEIEKAHPSVFDIFLQVLDEGKMHDRLGKEGDFSNAVILFTSNIGAEQIIESFNKGVVPKSDELLEKMASFFRPEFLARITEIIPFAPIAEQNVVKIFDIHSAHLFKLLDLQGITFTISDTAKEAVAMMGFTPRYGARPLKGIIRTKLRKPLSRMIITGEIKKGSQVHLDMDENKELKWTIQ